MLSTLSTADRLGALHERLFLDAVDAIVLEDLDGRIIDLNPAAADLLGWTRDELLGQPYTMLVPDGLYEEAAALRRRCASGARLQGVHSIRIGKDGAPRRVRLSLSLLEAHNDAPAAIATVAVPEKATPASAEMPLRDLRTEARDPQTEARDPQTEASEPRNQALGAWAEVTPAGVFDVDLVTGDVYWSPEMFRMLGRSPEERAEQLGEDGLPHHVHPDDRERLRAAIKKGHDPDGDGRVESEHRVLRADGETRWLLVKGRTLFAGDGAARRPARALGIAFDITERKQAEEARMKALLDVSSHAAWVCDSSGRGVEESPSWCALSGQTPQAWIASGWLEAVHPEEREAATAAWHDAVHRRASFEGEWPVVTSSGETRYLRIRAIPLINDDDTVRSWVGIGEDVTSRKQAELEAARASEREHEANALLDAIFAAAPIGLGFWDRDLRFQRINERLAEMHGLSVAEHIGKRLDELLPDIVAPDDLYLKWREILATGEPWLGVEVRGETPAQPGQQRTWKEDFFPVRVHGEIVGLAAVVQEITERRLAEAQLRESEARFRQMADNAPFMVWVTGPDRGCLFLSRSWYEFTGLEPSTGLGSGWLSAVHPDDRGWTERVFRDAQERLAPFRIEFRLRRRDGEYRWVLQAAAPRFSPVRKFKGYIGSIIDITERKRAEQALEHADRRKDEFLATLAHELRNPLAPLTTATELLERLPAAEPSLDEIRQMIGRQLNHLKRLVDDLLETSRITTGRIVLRRRRVDMIEVVQHSLETSRPLIASRNHRVETPAPAGPIEVDGDPVRLAQVLTNLLNNSAKYTAPGGVITVRLVAEGPDAIVSVTDNGIGIAPHRLAHLFDGFRRVDEPREDEGLGLGLSLVKGLVELHGGSVQARSEGLGRGATFVVRLPLSRWPRAAEAVHGGPTEQVKRRILVVDDNDDAASSLKLLLEHAGHDVRVAGDGRTALDAASELEPDVVLLDIGLPDMDGWQLARALRERVSRPELKLIAVSGYGQRADRRRSREAGIDRHLTKPVAYADISACL